MIRLPCWRELYSRNGIDAGSRAELAPTKPRQRGFTLLELLIAIAIFALLGLATYRMLDSVLRADTVTREHERQLRELTRALSAFERDLRQVTVRPIRDGFGDAQPALHSDLADATALELSRVGWRNPLGQPRAEVQRVRWQLSGEQWQRRYWRVLDRAQDSAPQIQQALDGVESLSLRYLDKDGQWQPDWPPANASGDGLLTELPRAVELRLQHRRHGELRRLLRLPDLPAQNRPGAPPTEPDEGPQS